MDSRHNEPFAGQCICGRIKFTVKLTEAEKKSQTLCHCDYCKRMTGACFTRSIFVPLGNFEIHEGRPKQFVQLKEAPRATFYFCDNCGTQLYATHAIVPDRAIIRVGTLDRQAEITDLAMQTNCENESPLLKIAAQQSEGRFPGFPPMPS